jgi:putative pyruvate formate lyase activating enzyme
MLWNSNFFMTEAAMRILRLLTDVWLPDFKFGPGRCAIGLSRTPRYWETVTRNLALLGQWGEDLTIRHLVMPNHVACCTEPILDWLAETLPYAPVNIMDQYHPDTFTDPASASYQARYEALARRPNRTEMARSHRLAQDRGLPFETVTRERRFLSSGH